jgi:hypothetical protein
METAYFHKLYISISCFQHTFILSFATEIAYSLYISTYTELNIELKYQALHKKAIINYYNYMHNTLIMICITLIQHYHKLIHQNRTSLLKNPLTIFSTIRHLQIGE